MVCYNNTACCTNGNPIYYVNPMNGDIQNASNAKISQDPPIWWDPVRMGIEQPRDDSNSSETAIPIVGLAAIGAGCAAAGIGLGLLAWKLLFRRKRREWAQKLAKAREDYAYHETKAATRSTISQLHSDHSSRQELDSESRGVVELESQSRRVQELDPQPKKLQELP
jgi:hypothetical protein